MRGLAPAIGAALFGLVLGVNSALAAVSVVDGFETIEGWSAVASEGAQVWLAQEPGRTGQALRIDYDLGNGQGYVIVRKSFSFPVPKNFAFTFDLLGEGQPNNFEFKLVDPSQRNVWWWRQPNVTWPTTWQTTTIRRSRLELAWGTAPTVKLQKVGSIEYNLRGTTSTICLRKPASTSPKQPAPPVAKSAPSKAAEPGKAAPDAAPKRETSTPPPRPAPRAIPPAAATTATANAARPTMEEQRAHREANQKRIREIREKQAEAARAAKAGKDAEATHGDK